MAQENPGWGDARTQAALAIFSRKVGRGTVANVVNDEGMESVPQRQRHISPTYVRRKLGGALLPSAQG